MKKTLIAIIAGITLYGCTDKKAEEKAALDAVIKVHDKVMDADEQLMKNKMLLDSMVKFNSTADIKDSVYMYLAKVSRADSAMGVWMHNFDPERPGKSHQETMTYMNAQKVEITALDSQLNKVVTNSSKYLKKMGMK